ncbi:hypothetical protein CEXT_213901 [Caerostris extrusa]|uniref:Maturase K n=1 Tax=Caerostris extrusa TaxID=172846 RepID=A0AAV4MTA5_CAEEX|nr:hypothetical protein CEXT_213901 [Caerostris extrusa]
MEMVTGRTFLTMYEFMELFPKLYNFPFTRQTQSCISGSISLMLNGTCLMSCTNSPVAMPEDRYIFGSSYSDIHHKRKPHTSSEVVHKFCQPCQLPLIIIAMLVFVVCYYLGTNDKKHGPLSRLNLFCFQTWKRHTLRVENGSRLLQFITYCTPYVINELVIFRFHLDLRLIGRVKSRHQCWRRVSRKLSSLLSSKLTTPLSFSPLLLWTTNSENDYYWQSWPRLIIKER